MKRTRDNDFYHYNPLVVYSNQLESYIQQFNKPRIVDNLPDDVLQTILKYLPTNEAVRTCILSRRWQHLWKSVPVLDFPHWNHQRVDHSRFNKFVDNVCNLHAPYPLERFHLIYGMLEKSDMDCLNTWLDYAITIRKVQNLDFRLHPRGSYKMNPKDLPHSLFNSETLVELTLSLGGRVLNLPSIISLPKLKLLHLEDVVRLTIQNLMDSAPSLETLRLIKCLWMNVFDQRISSLHLRELEIITSYFHFSMPALSVNCPRLEKLTYRGELVNEFRLCGPTNNSLNDATIVLRTIFSAENMLKLLYSVAAVKTLSFYVRSNKGLDPLSQHDEQCLNTFPVFENLVELKCSIISFDGKIEQTMLNKCPCLEKMEFHLTKTPRDCKTLCDLCDRVATKHLETHLKKVTIRTRFSYLRSVEIETVKMLLRRSLLLEQLVIVLPTVVKAPNNKQEVAEAMANELRLLYKASTSCRVFVYYHENGSDIWLTC